MRGAGRRCRPWSGLTATRPEVCNAFDDGCDGVVDNGQLRGPSGVCFEGQCTTGDLPAGAGAPADGGQPTGDGTGGGGQSAPGATLWRALLLLTACERARSTSA